MLFHRSKVLGALLGVGALMLAGTSAAQAHPGALVEEVVPGSAAALAFMLPGDVIVEMNGQPVTSLTGLRHLVLDSGGHVEMLVLDARTGHYFVLDAYPAAGVLGVRATMTDVPPPALEIREGARGFPRGRPSVSGRPGASGRTYVK